ncbi:MAG: class I SAM-dependent methyltransferase [Polyangiales bacterium]
MPSDDKIAPTAHYTAYAWFRLGFPYAERFATTEGAALFWSFRLAGEWVAAALPNVPSMLEYLAQRHLAIEHVLDEARPDLVVEIGAGLSRRGVTWALDRDTDYVEVDLPHMVEAKRARIEARFAGLERARLKQHHRLVVQDVLGDDFEPWLRETVKGKARPVVIAEGLFSYFSPEDRARLARAIRNALPAGGIFTCDARAKEGGAGIAIGARVLKAGIKLVTRGRGVREDFASHDEVRAFFRKTGFSSSDPIDLRDVPGAPKVPTPARVWRARV